MNKTVDTNKTKHNEPRPPSEGTANSGLGRATCRGPLSTRRGGDFIRVLLPGVDATFALLSEADELDACMDE